jgi:predicted DNA-binding transcriptional regulator YafY
VVLEIDRGWDEELIPQLLGLGDAAEVLEPTDVRDRISTIAGRIVARYAGRPLRSLDARSLGG